MDFSIENNLSNPYISIFLSHIFYKVNSF